MNKSEFLTNEYSKLADLIHDPRFTHHLAQARARAIRTELGVESGEIEFTFNTTRVWKQCDHIFAQGDLFLREQFGNKEDLRIWIRLAARAFEFLSRFAPHDQRESLLLSSAMCYHIAGYQANAHCLSKLIERSVFDHAAADSESNPPDKILTRLFRSTLISMLKQDVPQLQESSSQALLAIRDLQTAVIRESDDGLPSLDTVSNLIAHAYFQQCCADFVQFCLSGDPVRFSATQTDIEKSYEYFRNLNDATLGAITSDLRTTFNSFAERSTWISISRHATDLNENPIWKAYLRNLAFDKSIVEFWKSQIKAIQSGLLTSDDSFVVQMPTSAGKTLIAELAILAALTTGEEVRCLYIAPYRALVNEIEKSLADTLGAVGYRVSNLIGGFEFDAFQQFLVIRADVLVATPEKTELLLRTHPEYFQNLAVVVVDEGHIVDEGIPSDEEMVESDKTLLDELEQNSTLGRGPLLELLITRLKRKLPDVRFIFLSAVMPEVNARDFVDWLSRNKQEPLKIERSERPSRQVIAKFEWRNPQNGEIEYTSLPRLQGDRHPWVPFFISRQQYLTGNLTPTGRPERRSWPDIKNKAQSTAMLATRCAVSGPVLVFCAQKSDVKAVIENLVTSLKYLAASNKLPVDEMTYVEDPELESSHLAVEWLGEDHPLTVALHYGVGLHYGPLPDPVRQAVENEFRSGKIRILVSTNTLGQGVNMPIKTAIIYSLERRWAEKDPSGQLRRYRQKVKKRDFWNICGRAGRAGMETEGQVIFVTISEVDKYLYSEFINRANLEEVDSALYKLLKALTNRRIDQDSLLDYLDSHILAILAEEIVDTQDESALRDFLGTSLVGIQAIRKGVDIAPLASAIGRTSSWVAKQVPDEETRRVYSSTGLRLSSCKTIAAAVDQFLETTSRSSIKQEQATCDLGLLEAAYRACHNLPEMKLTHTVEYHGPEDEFEIILSWVSGQSVSDLRSQAWVGSSDEFSQYIADRVTYKLPWGFNGFLAILAFQLKKEFNELPMAWQHLASMMKFGVNNVIACWVSSLGISSRQMALQLANEYEYKGVLTFLDFVRWMTNLPTDLIIYDLGGSEFEKQRLLDSILSILPDDEQQEFVRRGRRYLYSPVRGIPYEDRALVASQVKQGDRLTLEAEPDNPYDPYAIRVIFASEHIGYVQRDKAKILSREMRLGRETQARVRSIRPATHDYPFPWIEMRILLQ